LRQLRRANAALFFLHLEAAMAKVEMLTPAQRPNHSSCIEFIDNGLLCPACQSPNLHHFAVRVFSREREDGDSILIEVRDTEAIWLEDGAEKTNPSTRRDGIAIRFWCEGCSILSELTLAQHKGTTDCRWRRVGRTERI
jgi:hypothetical protein